MRICKDRTWAVIKTSVVKLNNLFSSWLLALLRSAARGVKIAVSLRTIFLDNKKWPWDKTKCSSESKDASKRQVRGDSGYEAQEHLEHRTEQDRRVSLSVDREVHAIYTKFERGISRTSQ